MKRSRLAPVALVLGALCLIPAGAYGQRPRLFGPRCSNSYSRPVPIVLSTSYTSSCPTGHCGPANSVGSYPSNAGRGVSYPSGPAPRPGVIGRMLEGSGSR